MSAAPATRDVELGLLARFGPVAGMDEVGRGALAGPVAVGVALVDASVGEPPAGLTDSKALTPRRREALCDPIRGWVCDASVGYASPAEVDTFGITGALRLAGMRALVEITGRGRMPGVVLLDGIHDWLTAPQADLFSQRRAVPTVPGVPQVPVVTRVKADLTCAVVSAASVLAKVARDEVMTRMEDPGYDWAHNKGYASPSHVRALAQLGPCALHRRSWHLPGVADPAERA